MEPYDFWSTTVSDGNVCYLCASAGVLSGASSWCTPSCIRWTDTCAPGFCRQVTPLRWPAPSAPCFQSLFSNAAQFVSQSRPGPRCCLWPAPERTGACWWPPSPVPQLPAGLWASSQGSLMSGITPRSCLKTRCWRLNGNRWRPGFGYPDCLPLPWCGGSLGPR